MDPTDLAIFTQLVATDPFRSDEALGRAAGITGKAARRRRRRMEARGVLSDYGLHPAAEVLGRHAVAWRYVGKDWSELPVAELAQVEDLAYVMSFRPAFHRVVRFTTDPEPPPEARLARLLGRPLGGPLGERQPTCSMRSEDLSAVDWKVLEAVVGTPRATYATKARQANVSARTFRQHQVKLEAAHALQCAMILNLEREAGLATYGIWLRVDDAFDERSVELPRLWDRPHWTQHPRGVFLLGSAENYFEARQLELRLRALPGVVEADPLIPAGGFFARGRMLAWIRDQREGRGRPPRPPLRRG